MECKKELKLLKDSLKKFKMLPINSIEKYELDTLKDIVSTYGLFRFKKKLEPREVVVMSFFIKYGYSDNTKKKIINNLEIKRRHLTQLIYKLRKKGLLLNGEFKKQNKTLSKDMQALADYFNGTDKEVRILITIKKDEN